MKTFDSLFFFDWLSSARARREEWHFLVHLDNVAQHRPYLPSDNIQFLPVYSARERFERLTSVVYSIKGNRQSPTTKNTCLLLSILLFISVTVAFAAISRQPDVQVFGFIPDTESRRDLFLLHPNYGSTFSYTQITRHRPYLPSDNIQSLPVQFPGGILNA